MKRTLTGMAGLGAMVAMASTVRDLKRVADERQKDRLMEIDPLDPEDLGRNLASDLDLLDRPTRRMLRKRPRGPVRGVPFTVFQSGPQTWGVSKGDTTIATISQAAPNRFQWRLAHARRHRDRNSRNTGHATSLSKALTAIGTAMRGR